MKKIIIIIILALIFITIFIFSKNTQDTQEEIVGDPFNSFCYYHESPDSNGFNTVTWMRIENTQTVTGSSTLQGEYHNISSQAESTRGVFVGEYRINNEDSSYLESKTLITIQSEGPDVVEEFMFMFNPNDAKVAIGEKVDRGDGIFIFADSESINFNKALSAVPCDFLEEKLAVEAFLKENISTLTTAETVHGGTWYVVSSTIDVDANTGSVIYEDGHIQETSDFEYNYSNGMVELNFVEVINN